MATTKKFLDYTGLQYFFKKLKGIFVQKVASGSETYLTVSTEKDADNNVTATTIGFQEGIITGGTGTGYTVLTKLTTQGYVDEKVASVETTVTSGLNITGVTTDNYLKIDNKNVGIDETKIAKGTGTTTVTETNLVTEGYVTEKINETVAKAVVYKGTTDTIPTGTAENGDMYKVTANLTGDTEAKIGDVIIYNGDSKAWEVIPAGDDIEYTGVKVGETVVISPIVGGDVEFATADGETLFTISGEAGKITFASAEKLTKAVDKIEKAVANESGVTIGDATYSGQNILGTDTDTSGTTTIYGIKAYVDAKVGGVDAGVTSVTSSEKIGAISVNETDVTIGGADKLANLISNGVTAVTVDDKAAIVGNTVAILSDSTYDDSKDEEKAKWTANGAGTMTIKVGGNDVTIAQRITDDEIAAICV